MEESKVQYGQEYGKILIRLAKYLLKNQNLLRLLINTNKDPLDPNIPDIVEPLQTVFNKNIKVVPLLLNEDLTTSSKVVILFDSGRINITNFDNEDIDVIMYVYCPFVEWLISGDTLRPFAIMSEIRKSIQDKRINGIGEITFQDFSLSTLTEETGCYALRFKIHAFT